MTPAENTPGKGRYHHGDLRRALLDAALEILREGGDLSLRAVARRAGVSHAAPYHHFADRQALVAAIAEEGLTQFHDALVRAAERTVDPSLQMLEIGIAYVRFAVVHPAHFRLMFSAELADRPRLPALQAAYDAAYGVLLAGVRRVLGPGPSPDELELHATHAWSLVHGLSNLILDDQVLGAASTPDDAERFAREVLLRSPHGPPGGMPRPGVSGSPPPGG